MAYEVTIPRLGWSMDEGVFVRWLKKDGDVVRRGEILFELEGEKATQEIEAVDEGILRIPPEAPQPGSTVPVGQVLGYLVAEGETVGAVAPTVAEVKPAAEVAVHSFAENSVTSTPRSEVIASPRAKRVAGELGVDWKQLKGTGAGGRIRESDIRAATSVAPATGTRLPISQKRRIIAERMLSSRLKTASVTITSRADAENLVTFRNHLKAEGGLTPSYQDIIIKLLANALRAQPLLAGRWEDDAILLPAADGLHIGMAVDTDDGLLVPVIRNVGGLSLAALASQSRDLVDKARSGKLSPAEMQGGVFTVTNLGAFGIDAFTPIINFPESAILGLGAVRREAVVLDNGGIAVRHQMTLSLTFDHRVIDGAPAARFLQTLIATIAEPGTVAESRSGS